jgi:integrase
MPELAVQASDLPATSKLVEELIKEAKELAGAAQSAATFRAYASDLKDFLVWCQAHGQVFFPASPQSVALYVASMVKAQKALSTIKRRMVAIAQAHKNASNGGSSPGGSPPNPVADPIVRKVLQGIPRKKDTKQLAKQRRKAALTGDLLREALKTLDLSTLKGLHDRALLLLAFSCASRRSEVAALDAEDLRFEQAGLVVTIRRSKTDQAGEGREIGVPRLPNSALCPVRAIQAWMKATGITAGPLFRTFRGRSTTPAATRITDRYVALLVKRALGDAEIDGDFSGHSIRSGFITEAAIQGVSESAIAAVSGHKSVEIMRGYVRRANVLKDCPLSSMLGNAA